MTPKNAGPRIVAELGRPETPEETAARKAEASRKHRANQTMLNLVVALIASLGVVLLLVLVVVRPDTMEREPVDYRQVASSVQPDYETPLISPQLPDGWSSNAARIERGADDVASWYIGLITPENQFIGVRQGIDANPSWLAAQLEFSRPSGTATAGGVTWEVHDNRTADDPGNMAYVMTAQIDTSTVVLFGTAPDAEFEFLAAEVAGQLTGGAR